MTTLASVLIAVPDDRPLCGLISRVFDQSVKGVEVFVAAPVRRDDAGALAIQTGHPLPVANLLVPGGPPGKALNEAARMAHGHYLVALSYQAGIRDDRWLYQLLEPFLDDRIAAVSGCDYDLDRLALQDPRYVLTLADFLCAPQFGVSQQNAAFRRDLLLQHPFDEQLCTCADKQWTYRMLCEGYRILMAYEARVELPDPEDAEAALRRFWRDHQAIASFLETTDRARLLWKWAWSRRDPCELFKAISLGHRLKRQRSFEPCLPDAMAARKRFEQARKDAGPSEPPPVCRPSGSPR